MKSKFKIGSYLALIFIFFSIVLFINVSYKFIYIFNSKLAGFFIISLLFFVIVIISIELKDKIIAIEFEPNGIKINRFCGIKNSIFIDNNEIEGFHNSIVTTKYGIYNYIYLIKGNKKIVKISEQYHKNFHELSNEINKRYINLGFIKSNFIAELKDLI